MSAQNDADRLVHAFLMEGPAELSQPLNARIRGEIHATKQRASRPWRNLSMPRTFWVVAPLAAAVVAIGGLLIVSWGGPKPAPSPSPSVIPSPTAGVASSIAPTAFPIAPGEAWIVVGGSDRATLIRADGTGRHDILVNIGVSVSDPAWSPDGNQLVFEGNGTRGSQLYVANADGTGRRQLTPTPDGCPDGNCTEAVNPAWSPDGTSIAYIAPAHERGAFSRSSLMVLNVASGASSEIYGTGSATLARPTWSPDSQSIAFEIDHYLNDPEGSAMKDSVIAVVDLARSDHQPKTITDPTLLAGYPSWHPTADLIVFRTNRFDNNTETLLNPTSPSDLYTIHSDGSGLLRVTRNAVGGVIVRAPSWTPDGRILFTSRDPLTAAELLRLVDADGKNEVTATGTTNTTGQGRWRPGT